MQVFFNDVALPSCLGKSDEPYRLGATLVCRYEAAIANANINKPVNKDVELSQNLLGRSLCKVNTSVLGEQLSCGAELVRVPPFLHN